MTRIGKIGRLPRGIRDELGQRIEDGEPGRELVKWLNGLDRVQEVLKEQFGGRPVTEQNLSDWKQNGHPESLQDQETQFMATRLFEQAKGLGEATDGREISGCFTSVLAAEMVRLARVLMDRETEPEKRWNRLCEVHRELSRLRCDDRGSVWADIARDRWNQESERKDMEDFEREKEARKAHLRGMVLGPVLDPAVAQAFGGGEGGKKMVELLHHIEYDLPLNDLWEKWKAESRNAETSDPAPGTEGAKGGETAKNPG